MNEKDPALPGSQTAPLATASAAAPGGVSPIEPDSDDIALKVRTEQMRALYERAPVATLSATAFAVAMAWEMRGDVPSGLLVGWLMVKCLVAGPRALHAIFFRRRKDDSLHWLNQFRYLLTLDGLVWGAAAFVIMPTDRAGITTLAAMLAAVSTIASFNVQSDWQTCRAALLAMMSPLIVSVALRFDEFGVFLALSLAIYVYFLFTTARRSNRRVTEMLTLRFANADLNRALSSALDNLRVEARAKDGFMASMSHELRTPLHGILGLTRILRSNARERDKPHLRLIARSGEHLLGVINNILEFSKFTAHGVDIDTDAPDVDVLRTIEEGVAFCRTTAEDRRVDLSLHVAVRRPLTANLDPYRLRQVVLNLVGNAIKFTDAGGGVSVVVTQSEVDNWLVLNISDSGVGMSQDTMERIFQPFVQADVTSTRRHGGTGLGLSITRAICKKLGGDVTCTSVLNEGSVFTVTLPLPRAQTRDGLRELDVRHPGMPIPARPDSAFASLDGHRASTRVLLAEDNEVNAIVGEAALLRIGVEVARAHDGRSVVAQMCTTGSRPGLVLLDCQMPEMDGYDAARLIRAYEREHGLDQVPIVALTASVFQADREQCREAGMNAFLSKPFSDAELRAVLALFKVVQAEAEISDSMFASLSL